MKRSLLLMLVLVAGCSNFETRVACSIGKDKAYSVSEYMQLGVSTKISDKDLPKLCGSS